MAARHVFLAAGDDLTVYIWSDPNGDMDPTDAQVLSSLAVNVTAGMLDSLNRFSRVAAELRLMKRGHLTLIASSPIARGLLPPVMRRFRDTHPDVTLSLETVPRNASKSS